MVGNQTYYGILTMQFDPSPAILFIIICSSIICAYVFSKGSPQPKFVIAIWLSCAVADSCDLLGHPYIDELLTKWGTPVLMFAMLSLRIYHVIFKQPDTGN